jgi:hypothetical protein
MSSEASHPAYKTPSTTASKHLGTSPLSKTPNRRQMLNIQESNLQTSHCDEDARTDKKPCTLNPELQIAHTPHNMDKDTHTTQKRRLLNGSDTQSAPKLHSLESDSPNTSAI